MILSHLINSWVNKLIWLIQLHGTQYHIHIYKQNIVYMQCASYTTVQMVYTNGTKSTKSVLSIHHIHSVYCIHMCTCTFLTHVCIYTCVSYIRVYVYTCVYTYVYTYIRTHVYIHMCCLSHILEPPRCPSQANRWKWGRKRGRRSNQLGEKKGKRNSTIFERAKWQNGGKVRWWI